MTIRTQVRNAITQFESNTALLAEFAERTAELASREPMRWCVYIASRSVVGIHSRSIPARVFPFSAEVGSK